MATDGIEKFQVAHVVSAGVKVMLHYQDANCGGGSFERHTQPRGGGGTNQFDLFRFHQMVEFALGDELGHSSAKNIGSTTTADFLRRWGRVEFIGKERKLEGIVFRLVQGYEAIFCRHG